MKKLILVLGLATLFSCEKEEDNCGCYRITSIKQNGTYHTVSGGSGSFYQVKQMNKVTIITQNDCSKIVDIKIFYIYLYTFDLTL